MSDENLICRKQNGQAALPGGAIYQDELVSACHAFTDPKNPQIYLGWSSVEPCRPISGLAVLTNEASLARGMLIACYPGARREYWGVCVDEWPDAPHSGPDGIAELCTRLRNKLQSTEAAIP